MDHIEHSYSSALLHGIIGGFIGGITFAFAEMFTAQVLMDNALMPLHMIASIPLQRPPMEIDPTTALVVGSLFHMGFSVILGIIAALIAVSTEAFHATAVNNVLFATLFGFLVWPINFYFFAPLLNVPWFATDTDPVQQFIFHTFFFGTVLGIYFALTFPRTVHRLVPAHG